MTTKTKIIMAKKVGIIFGQEDTFPWAFIDKVNELGNGKVVAEPVQIDKVQQGIDYGYHVILDRMSQGVPFYRSYVKNAALMGTAVINNPFWFSADEKFFNNCLAMELGVPVPKTVLLPSNARPDDTSEKSFRNLVGPLDWDYIFNYIGFPAYMKPFDGGGWKDVYKVENADALFASHAETGQLVMMLQEEIVFDDYFRVYCLGQKYVHIMPYDPRKPFHERYVSEIKATGDERDKLLKTIHDYTLKLNRVTHLGRINSDLFKSNRFMCHAPLDELVQYRSAVVPSVEPEEVFVDVLLQVFPVAPGMHAP